MRTGRFRIKPQSSEYLEAEAQAIGPALKQVKTQLLNGEISAPEAAARAIQIFYLYRNKNPGKAKLSESILVNKTDGTVLKSVLFSELNGYSWTSLSLKINRSLVRWYVEPKRYVLVHHVPDWKEMLHFQTLGQRAVSLLIEADQLTKIYEEKFDAYGLLLHDLIHAERFFENENTYHGQVGFYRALTEFLLEFPDIDRQSKNEQLLHYLASDMNAHPLHQLVYLFGWFRRETSQARVYGQWWKDRFWAESPFERELDRVVGFQSQCSSEAADFFIGQMTRLESPVICGTLGLNYEIKRSTNS